jgi:uncharacterized membrane protein YciS (DUF1049 family)
MNGTIVTEGPARVSLDKATTVSVGLVVIVLGALLSGFAWVSAQFSALRAERMDALHNLRVESSSMYVPREVLTVELASLREALARLERKIDNIEKQTK